MAQFSMRLPKNLKNSLKEISHLSHRSQSQIATKAISEYVEKNEWRMKAMTEATRAADKGIFISHEKIDSWLGSWGEKNELLAPTPDIFPNK